MILIEEITRWSASGVQNPVKFSDLHLHGNIKRLISIKVGKLSRYIQVFFLPTVLICYSNLVFCKDEIT